MTGEQLNAILKRLETLNTVQMFVEELIEYTGNYQQDIPILLAEIERLNKIIDSMKEESK